MRWILLVGMLVTAALAGCAEEAPTETTDGTTDAGETGGTDKATDPGETGQTAGEVNETLASFTANASVDDGLTAGQPFNVTIDTDLPADVAANATWTADVFAGNDTVGSQSGTGVPATTNFTLADAGNYTLSFLVEADGYQDANGTLALSAAAPVVDTGPRLPTRASIEDPELDGVPPFADLTQADFEVTDGTIEVVLRPMAVDPGAGDSPFIYQIKINGYTLENYVLGGVGLWDPQAGDAAQGSAGRDPVDGTVTFSVARSYLSGKGIEAPYGIMAQAMLGEGLLGGQEPVDLAPDSGVVELGAP